VTIVSLTGSAPILDYQIIIMFFSWLDVWGSSDSLLTEKYRHREYEDSEVWEMEHMHIETNVPSEKFYRQAHGVAF
jgi:hypothetical protein